MDFVAIISYFGDQKHEIFQILDNRLIGSSCHFTYNVFCLHFHLKACLCRIRKQSPLLDLNLPVVRHKNGYI